MKDEILSLRQLRYDLLNNILDKLDEQQLNIQPLENKRSIAELIHHIGMIDGFPFFLAKIVQRLFLYNTVKKVQDQELNGIGYIWDLEKGKKRTPKYKTKSSLLKQFEKNRSRILELNYKEKDRKYRFFSEYHANFHLEQLKLLLNKARINIE